MFINLYLTGSVAVNGHGHERVWDDRGQVPKLFWLGIQEGQHQLQSHKRPQVVIIQHKPIGITQCESLNQLHSLSKLKQFGKGPNDFCPMIIPFLIPYIIPQTNTTNPDALPDACTSLQVPQDPNERHYARSTNALPTWWKAKAPGAHSKENLPIIP